MPEELWTEVNIIVQVEVTKTIPKRKKCKKAKWLPEEALKIAEKRREERQRRKGKIYQNTSGLYSPCHCRGGWCPTSELFFC